METINTDELVQRVVSHTEKEYMALLDHFGITFEDLKKQEPHKVQSSTTGKVTKVFVDDELALEIIQELNVQEMKITIKVIRHYEEQTH